MSSLGSGTGAPAASAAATASASTESAAATVAGKEEQGAIDAAGSSSGGSKTDRLPVWCGAVGAVQVTEAALTSSAADHAKRSVQGAVGWARAGQAARGVCTADGMAAATTSLRGVHALPGHKKIRAKNKATEYTNKSPAWRALSSSSNLLLARLTFPAGAISDCVEKTSSARESKTQDARRHGAESSSIRRGSCGVERETVDHTEQSRHHAQKNVAGSFTAQRRV